MEDSIVRAMRTPEKQDLARQMRLVFLPPYSPNLNLIERLWKFCKKRVLRHFYARPVHSGPGRLLRRAGRLPRRASDLDDGQL